MPQRRKQHLFYNNGELNSVIGSDRSVTVFSALNAPLVERSTETSLLAADAQRSIIYRSRGKKACELTYTVYGHCMSVHLMGFTGKRHDEVTNCYLLGNGYRAYSSRLARFYSPDSLSPFTRNAHNSYGYCLGDPVNYHDPSGHMMRRFSSATDWVQRKANEFKAKIRKPRIHYIDKARAAIERRPSLSKYSVLVDDPNATKETLKPIYKIADGEDRLANLTETAIYNWRTKWGSREDQPIEGPISDKFDYSKYLTPDDEFTYVVLPGAVSEQRVKANKLLSQYPASEAAQALRQTT